MVATNRTSRWNHAYITDHADQPPSLTRGVVVRPFSRTIPPSDCGRRVNPGLYLAGFGCGLDLSAAAGTRNRAKNSTDSTIIARCGVTGARSTDSIAVCFHL